MTTSLILASQSPRRSELLSQLGYQFTCLPADVDESVKANETPQVYVSRLALAKAQHIANSLMSENKNKNNDATIVLGSDTCVVINNTILGKPRDLADCQQQLQLLSANVHQVLTAVSVVKAQLRETVLVSTDVEFKSLTEREINNYWLTGEPQDKAGSYGIQGIGGQFVKQLRGSYSSVVGLPLYETSQLLTKFGLPSAINQ